MSPADKASSDGDPFDPTGTLAKLAGLVTPERPLVEVLHDIAELAVQQVPAAEDCSVTLVNGTSAFSPAYAGELARRLDENQFRLGNGPCLDAGASGELLVISDVDQDDRWPAYLSIATVVGLGSSLSAPLPVQQDVLGALNFYSSRPHAFDADAIDLAETFAAHAAAAISQAQFTDNARQLADQLQDVMRTRAVIEQAKGILMAVRRCSAQQAFEHLRSRSQASGRKLRDVAGELVSEASGHEVPSRPGERG